MSIRSKGPFLRPPPPANEAVPTNPQFRAGQIQSSSCPRVASRVFYESSGTRRARVVMSVAPIAPPPTKLDAGGRGAPVASAGTGRSTERRVEGIFPQARPIDAARSR